MTRFTYALLALVVWAAPLSAAAHSLKELEAQLYDREKFFQPVNRPAPAFSLQDAEGRTVALEDLSGKVLVFNFVYTSCPDVCPLHAEKIREVQGMVNETQMRALSGSSRSPPTQRETRRRSCETTAPRTALMR